MRDDIFYAAIFILFLALIGAGFILLPGYLQGEMLSLTDGSTALNDLGAAGEFTNVKWGVPLAVISGLLAAAAGGLLSWALTRASARQGEVDILNFAEQKSEVITEGFRPFAAGVARSLNFAALINQELGNSLNSAKNSEGKVSIEEAKRIFLAEATDEIEQFRKDLLTLRDDALKVWGGPYTSMIAEDGLMKRGHHSDRLSELAALSATTREAARLSARHGFFDAEPKIVIANLTSLIDQITPERAFAVLQVLPQDERLRLMDVAGAIAGGQFCQLESLRALPGGRTLNGYFLNYGAAYLLMLVNALPHREDVATVIDHLLDRRSKIAREFLRQAGPDWSLYTFSRAWMEGFQDYDRRYAFAYAVVSDGKRTYTELYDPTAHGPFQ